MSAGFAIGRRPTRRSAGLDRLGVLLAAIVAAGLALQPFCLFRANRIVAAKPVRASVGVAAAEAQIVLGLIVVASVLLLLRTTPELRLAVSVLTLVLLALRSGGREFYLTPSRKHLRRVAPGGGFWFAAFAFAIALADAAVRLRMLRPSGGLPCWRSSAARSGSFCGPAPPAMRSPILREYGQRADVFWREARVHLFLAAGSLAAAAVVGIPLGILCVRVRPLRAALLNSLNILQTIPSMALFGCSLHRWPGSARMCPAHLRSASPESGLRPPLSHSCLFAPAHGIQHVAGLESVPVQARDAARGMGMTARQRFMEIETAPRLPRHPHRNPHRAGAEPRPCRAGWTDRRRRVSAHSSFRASARRPRISCCWARCPRSPSPLPPPSCSMRPWR